MVTTTMSKQWHGGKGSKVRNPNNKAYTDNYDKIFNKQKKNFTYYLDKFLEWSFQRHADKLSKKIKYVPPKRPQ